MTFKTAGSRIITASDVTDGSKTANASPGITVSAGTFTRLQLLTPGETAAPGTVNGKTGSPSAQAAGTALNVTVNAVDDYWNVAASTHTVGITCTDPNATLPANSALVAGTKTLSLTFKTAGSATVTATELPMVARLRTRVRRLPSIRELSRSCKFRPLASRPRPALLRAKPAHRLLKQSGQHSTVLFAQSTQLELYQHQRFRTHHLQRC